MEKLEFTIKEAAAPLMSVAAPLWFKKFWKKNPKSRIFFLNFQNHKGAATDIKGAAASLLANSKIFIFIKKFSGSASPLEALLS